MKRFKKLLAILLITALVSISFPFGGIGGAMMVFATSTQVNDDAAGVNYTGSWTNNDSCAGYINNDLHWSNTNGSYVQYTFTGTSIQWIGAKNNDHGKANVYIDSVLDATVDTYNSTWIMQQVIYQKTGLTYGSHTIKIEVTNTKNSSSSNYYQDLDAFQYDTGATPTPTSTPTPTPAATPTPTPTPIPSYVWTEVNDNAAGTTYSGMNPNTYAGYYMGDMHSANAVGAWGQYSFTGTGIMWIGAKNTDHGQADIYIDGTWDSTVDTSASSWLMQQTLYTKTGLSYGIHTIKIQIKTSGYQDIDAFEYYAPAPTATPTPVPIPGDVAIPDPVPHYGVLEKNFLGSGVSGAGGDVYGVWDFLIGPDYTSPNFISSETVSLIVDGTAQSLNFQMYRGRKTGMFYGTQTIGDLQVYLCDITNDQSPWVARVLRIDNYSNTTSHTVKVKGSVTPSGGTVSVQNSEAVSILMGVGASLFGSGQSNTNWANRSSLITFSEPCTVTQNGSSYDIVTNQQTINARSSYYTGLYHYQHYDEGKTNADYVNMIRARVAKTDLQTCITGWGTWIDSGNMYNSQITDQKARDVVESCLLAVKMQQNRDGGTIAGTRVYSNSYVRDTHGGCRLLGITGHNAEVKAAIQTIDHKWSIAGFIPNWWSMGSDSFIGDSFNNRSSEGPAYYILMIRDYYNRTGDITVPDGVYNSMKYAVDTQLNWMSSNSWRINFNGDETEQYCVKVDGQTYGGFPAPSEWNNSNWSFQSAALAVASTQYFIDYLNLKGNTSLANTYQSEMNSIKSSIDTNFWSSSLNAHDWMRKPDNSWPTYRLPNYDLIPLWTGTVLNSNRQNDDALAMKAYINATTGFIPDVPGDVNGMCGHGLALMLYDMKKLNDPKATDVYNTIMNSPLLSCWGTVSEYYGPNGTPNGHNYRVFESGPNGEAIIRYFIGF